MVGSVVPNGLYLNMLMSHCRETWAGGGWHVWGGWGGIRGQYWTSKENVGAQRQMVDTPPPPRLLGARHTLYAGAHVMGVFDGACSLGGEG